ncbi:AfsR/SARP family transcriptional regulator [Actinomadura barringtoniae]|uniref:AfsR/SARP family transcriptional regulator n=1 Tax=Actinomadura barringtoniae TaxID=1427535 RepID=A0A939PKP4_9ACTN|nr:AfsR/SARP family transcriptional regulator [Actinomadura barringtoniae]MBO2450934.1 AfsR/SARP family transcriptional regulator [Actinomadura barringtoniae]
MAGPPGSAESVPGTLQRTLLAVLLLNEGHALHFDALIEELWGVELPARPREALTAQVARLRRTLERREPGIAGRLRQRSHGYRLDVGDDELDAASFRRLRTDARRTEDPWRASFLLNRALALWSGPALADVRHGPITRAAVEQLEDARRQVHAALIQVDLDTGRADRVVEDIELLIARYPLHEPFYDQLMRALCDLGRPAEAVGVYHRARGRLLRDLGVEPSPALQRRLHTTLSADRSA